MPVKFQRLNFEIKQFDVSAELKFNMQISCHTTLSVTCQSLKSLTHLGRDHHHGCFAIVWNSECIVLNIVSDVLDSTNKYFFQLAFIAQISLNNVEDNALTVPDNGKASMVVIPAQMGEGFQTLTCYAQSCVTWNLHVKFQFCTDIKLVWFQI